MKNILKSLEFYPTTENKADKSLVLDFNKSLLEMESNIIGNTLKRLVSSAYGPMVDVNKEYGVTFQFINTYATLASTGNQLDCIKIIIDLNKYNKIELHTIDENAYKTIDFEELLSLTKMTVTPIKEIIFQEEMIYNINNYKNLIMFKIMIPVINELNLINIEIIRERK